MLAAGCCRSRFKVNVLKVECERRRESHARVEEKREEGAVTLANIGRLHLDIERVQEPASLVVGEGYGDGPVRACVPQQPRGIVTKCAKGIRQSPRRTSHCERALRPPEKQPLQKRVEK